MEVLEQIGAFDYVLDEQGKVINATGPHLSKTEMRKRANRIGDFIVHEWERCLGCRLVNDISNLSMQTNKDQLSGINYLVYKTIKCSINYSNYRPYQKNVVTMNNIRGLVESLFVDSTHITMKIRRTIAMLLFGHYGTTMDDKDGKYTHTCTIDEFRKNIKDVCECQKKIMKELCLQRPSSEKAEIEKPMPWQEDELLPSPAIYESITLMTKNETEIPMDTMSSGERQMLYTLGTMVYQLHNINSVKGDKIRYSCVNIMIDEIELYFHPEYQRKLIKYLLNILKTMRLEQVKHINMMIVTHSPFVLSDIPSENILYLHDGNDVSDSIKINPLGANINDVLAQSFFLNDGFMGDYIVDKINEMVSNMEVSGGLADKRLESGLLAKTIGDPYVRQILLDMLQDYDKNNKKG